MTDATSPDIRSIATSRIFPMLTHVRWQQAISPKNAANRDRRAAALRGVEALDHAQTCSREPGTDNRFLALPVENARNAACTRHTGLLNVRFGRYSVRSIRNNVHMGHLVFKPHSQEPSWT